MAGNIEHGRDKDSIITVFIFIITMDNYDITDTSRRQGECHVSINT